MLLTIILLALLLYAAWKWWSYFCTTMYLADYISKHDIENHIKQGVSSYMAQNISWLLRKFLKS